MIFRSATSVIVILAATAAWTQSGQPGTTKDAPILNLQSQPGQIQAGRRGPVVKKPADPQGLAAMHQQVEEMESTLSQMRVVLKQMQAKTAESKSAGSLSKANLNMWELMVGHLDKELQDVRLTLAAREDLEARRADLYRQADTKAAAQAQVFRAAQAARFAEAQKNATGTATPTGTGPIPGQSGGQSPVAPPAPAQSSPVQPAAVPATNNSASPN